MALVVGVSPGELPKHLPGLQGRPGWPSRWVLALESFPDHQRRPGWSSRWVPALESFPNTSQAIRGDLDGPRDEWQPWRASQTPPRPSGETWMGLEVGASPGELPKHLPGYQWRPGWPSSWVLVLESFPDPCQAIRETWEALEVGASPSQTPPRASGETWMALEVGANPGGLPRPSGRPGRPSRWVPALERFPNNPQGINGDLEGPQGLPDGLGGVWKGLQGWHPPQGPFRSP